MLIPGRVSDVCSVRGFSQFLQHPVEMGKTTAGMCIERSLRARHNGHHQAALRAAGFFHPPKGTNNEQF
ncbi:MAG TPA: hypothetical protein DEO80_17305 [Leclercia adecarboxylata]|nr:hypothetical protein [Leclercia adecarboxylata]